MEELFGKHVEELRELGRIGDTHVRIAELVDRAAEELAPIEIEAYMNRQVNLKEQVRVMKKYGLLGLQVPEEYSGMGGDAAALALAFERLGQLGMGLVTGMDVQLCLTEAILARWGTDEQKKRYLVPEAKGDKLMSFCLTEPEHGSDPSSLQVSFDEVDGGFSVSGEKYLITNGSFADAFIVFARNKQRGISAIIVDRDEKHVSVEMEIREKPGLFTSNTTLLKFDGAFAPRENLIGSFGKGLSLAYTGLLSGRLGIAAGCVGAIEDCLNAALSRSREREQFGKPIGRHQLVQKRLATIEEQFETARLCVDRAAYWKTKYDARPDDIGLRKSADHNVTLAKVIATNAAGKAADNAMQLFGGFGYSIIGAPGRHYIDVRASRIYEGSNDVLELKLASDLLGAGFEAYG
jgi:alkylation response protein AidB-like acyl-CoA dehydrogenase